MNSVSCSRYPIGNVDELEEAIKQRSNKQSLVEITPISGSRVIGNSALIDTGDANIYFAEFGDVRVRGIVSNEFLTFGVFLNSASSNSLWNKEIRAGDIGWIPPGNEHDAIYGSKVQFALIMLRYERVLRFLETRGLQHLEGLFRQSGYRHFPELMSAVIAEQFQAARSAILKNPHSLKSTDDFNSVVDLLLDEILHALTFDARSPAAHTAAHYASLVKKTEDYLYQRPNSALNINELCGKLQVSRRTFHRAFRDVVGVAPNTYLRNWRLSRIHHDLKQGCADSVTECAQRWGFSELGRFAGYYRDVFGALPSDNLGRTRGP